MKLKLRNGFTVIEFMVVVALVAIGVSMFVRFFVQDVDKAKLEKTHQEIAKVETALLRYWQDHQDYPTTGQGIAALVATIPSGSASSDDGGNGYLKGFPRDGWNNPFAYSYDTPDDGARLVSFGADGKPGGENSAADIVTFVKAD